MPHDPTASGPDTPDPAPTAPAHLAALAELGQIVLDAQPLGQVLHRVADIAQRTLAGADQVSITVLEDGRARTAAFTGQVAATLDERQYQAGFGPCLEVARDGGAIRVDVAGHQGTYPEFERAATRAGVRSSLSVALTAPERPVGGLNIYTFSDDPVPGEALPQARSFARFAGVAIANATLYAAALELIEQLERAVGSRAGIEQAKGVLVAQLRLSPDEAFAHLVALSQQANRKLREIAAETVQAAQDGRL